MHSSELLRRSVDSMGRRSTAACHGYEYGTRTRSRQQLARDCTGTRTRALPPGCTNGTSTFTGIGVINPLILNRHVHNIRVSSLSPGNHSINLLIKALVTRYEYRYRTRHQDQVYRYRYEYSYLPGPRFLGVLWSTIVVRYS